MKKNSLKKIYKINSTRLVNSDWNLTLNRKTMGSKEIISLSDSQLIDFVHSINKIEYSESEVKKIRKEIKEAYKIKDKTEKDALLNLKFDELNKYTFIDDIIEVVMNKNTDFDRANKDFFINKADDQGNIIEKVKFHYLVTTTNGGKKSTAIYASEKVFTELHKKMENGRDTAIKAVPAKTGAYQALITSSSIALPFDYKPHEILVLDDCHKDILADVIFIKDSAEKNEPPTVIPMKDYGLDQNVNDGWGLISISHGRQIARYLGLDYLPSFQVRYSFCKGMLFSFPFKAFARLIAKNNIALDAWKNPKDIRKVKLILTTSMLKLWASYTSIDHYLKCSKENGYTFRIAKVTPKKLDDQRELSYQFLQPLKLTDDNISKLVEPTVNEIKEIQGRDYRKSILYLSGENQTNENFSKGEYDCAKALKVDSRMINDPFVRNTINKMIGKKINDTKMGELTVKNSNYQIVSGDPWTLCQSMFNMDTTGLLLKDQFYSKYFIDKNIMKTACFRAPMTSANNIRILNMVDSEVIQKWYRYMDTVTIFNSHDAAMNALNGMDGDGDSVFQTNNETILSVVEQLDVIICHQETAPKKKVTSKDLKKAAKASFGDEIGIITNRTASMINLQAMFSKGSEEYEELARRIKSGQLLQQNSIDKSKGIKSKSMPREWYDWKCNVVVTEDWTEEKVNKEDGSIEKIEHKKDTDEIVKKKELNMKILADKIPHFMIYRYAHKMKEWRKFKDGQDTNCWDNFGCTVNELIIKRELEKETESDENLSSHEIKIRDRQDQFIKWYHIRNPISAINSTMNRICFKVEDAFIKRITPTKQQTKEINDFDYTILITDTGFDEESFIKVENVYKEYIAETSKYQQYSKKHRIDSDDKSFKNKMFKENYKHKLSIICNGDDELLTNIVVELCYQTEKSKQFAWDMCGEQMVKNLLVKKNNFISFPMRDKKGDFEFKGEKYIMVTKKIKESELSSEEDYE